MLRSQVLVANLTSPTTALSPEKAPRSTFERQHLTRKLVEVRGIRLRVFPEQVFDQRD